MENQQLFSFDKPETNSLVVQPNELVRASYDMTVNEKRLLAIALSKLHNDSRREVDQGFLISFTYEEWNRTFKQNQNLSQVFTTANLRKMKSIGYEASFADTDNKREALLVGNWFSRVIKIKDNGKKRIEVELDINTSKMIEKMDTCFTAYKLLEIAKLKTFHTVRLFELLMQFKHTGQLVIFLDEFREAIGVVDKYPNYYNLKRRIIDPALADINENTELNVVFKCDRTEKTRGRKIEKIGFNFNPIPRGQYSLLPE